MFAKLFKPKWQHPEPKIRCLALRGMAVEKVGDRQIIESLLRDDPSEEVRLVAALRLLPQDASQLKGIFDLWEGFQDESLQQEYLETLAESCTALLEHSATRQTCFDVLKGRHVPTLSDRVVHRLTNVDALELMLPLIDDMAYLRELVVSHAHVRVRQAAIASLKDRQVLKALLAQFKGRDKTLYRTLKNRLQHLEPEKTPEAPQNTALLKVGFVDKVEKKSPAATHTVADDIADTRAAVAEGSGVESLGAGSLGAENAPDAEKTGTHAGAQPSEKKVSKPKKPALSAETQQQLDAQLAEVAQLIGQGEVKNARKLHQTCGQRLKDLSVKKQHALYQRWRELKTELDEYREWQRYAIVPKKEALIAQMQALVESPLPDEQHVERVQRLQADWKALGVADPRQENELWERFQEVSDEAFSKCQVYFDGQAELRRQNLAAREELVQQLEAYLDGIEWSKAQWRKVATTLRLSRQSWREAFPVTHKENRPLQKRFDVACDAIKKKLDEHRDRMAAQKKRMVSDMAELLASVESDALSLDDGLEKAKALQQTWSDMDYTHATLEKDLFAQFRQSADALFGKREAERAEQRALAENHVGQATEIIEALKASAQLTGDALLEAAKKLPQWDEGFKALGPFPKQQAKTVQADYKQAHQRFVKAVSAEQSRQRQQSFEVLWQLNERLSEVETAYLFSEADLSARVSALKDAWSDLVQDIPEEAEVLVNVRFDAFMSLLGQVDGVESCKDRLPALQSEKRALAVKMEIIADLASPEADQELRLSLQVDRLSETFSGQADDSVLSPAERLVLQWCRLSPNLMDTVENGFSQRFRRAYQQVVQLNEH